MKSILIPVLIAGALVVGGCSKDKKPAQSVTPANDPMLVPPMAPPAAYVPSPEPAPAPMPAVTATPAPKVAPRVTHTAKPAVTAKSTKSYVVKKGETLSGIAQAHKTTLKKVMALNPDLDPDLIKVGQKIKLP